MAHNQFQRAELLIGSYAMQTLQQVRVILFGVGGVGSWCAESLVRSGLTHITLVDSDVIAESNINRQLPATLHTIGKPKVEVLKERLLTINSDAQISIEQKTFSPENYDEFNLQSFHYILDCIDSLSCKVELIRQATASNAKFFSSMGASLKIDPLRIKVSEFWEVKGCPLAAIVRKRIRKGELPYKKFLCVYSDEVLQNKGQALPETMGEHSDDFMRWQANRAVINGTMVQVTASFGFVLASLVIKDIVALSEN